MNGLKNFCLERCAGYGLDITTVDRPTHQEFHLTFRLLRGEKPAEMVHRLALALRERDASVVRHEVFGSLTARTETMSALSQQFGRLDWPVMWVQGGVGAGQGILGMHVFAVAGTRVDTLDLDGQPVGRIFDGECVRHCLLGNVTPSGPSLAKIDQCRQVFERLEAILEMAGMYVKDVARTWFFLDGICDWYQQFNLVRNEFYREKSLFDGLMPASTGIGGKSPSGAAIIAGVWAVQKELDDFAITKVPSPLQCASTDYGSAFSRAVLMTVPDSRRLLISGTASIDPNGQSVHGGNVCRQIALSVEVVEQILSSTGLDFSNITRATAYFKNLGDVPVFEVLRRERGLEFLPILAVQADICRKELLFEIELDAIGV